MHSTTRSSLGSSFAAASSVALFLALALFSFAWAAPVHAGPKRDKKSQQEEEEVNYLALGARLVADGHYDRAASVLQEIDQADPKYQEDLPKLHFLLGTAYLKLNLHNKAKAELTASIKAGQTNEAVHVLLAQTHFNLGELKETVAELRRAPKTLRENPGVSTLMAEAQWKLKDSAGAIATLDRGIELFPEFAKLQQMKIGYLIELGLYQEVVRVGETYLKGANIKPDDYVAVAEGLRRSKQLGEARMIMEQAHLRFPDNQNVAAQLANIYHDLDRPMAAAMLYDRLSQQKAQFGFEAAEFYKDARRHARALIMNSKVLEPKKKLKQRLAILLDQESFEQIAAMEPSLSRSGLLSDESIRYALAYAFFKDGEFDEAERHLKLLTDAALFDKATALRKAMSACREAGWACY